MDKKRKVLSRFLLPIDVPEKFKRIDLLMGMIDAGLGSRVEKVSLLHVMAGRYLSTHMANVDLRTEFILESELVKRLKKQHVQQEIEPEMKLAEEQLRKAGVKAPIDIRVEDGDPVDRIAAVAADYSTILMERRGLSPLREVLVGSVTAGILRRNIEASIYLVGRKQEGGKGCPGTCCLIPVDGSAHSNAALAEAAVLINGCGCSSVVQEVILVHVLDTARFSEEMVNEDVPARSSEVFLQSAKGLLVDSGVSEDIITEVARFGNPAEVIEEEIRKRSSCMIFMGRRGRNAVSEIFMGSVSRKIVYHCPDHFVALVTAEKREQA